MRLQIWSAFFSVVIWIAVASVYVRAVEVNFIAGLGQPTLFSLNPPVERGTK